MLKIRVLIGSTWAAVFGLRSSERRWKTSPSNYILVLYFGVIHQKTSGVNNTSIGSKVLTWTLKLREIYRMCFQEAQIYVQLNASFWFLPCMEFPQAFNGIIYIFLCYIITSIGNYTSMQVYVLKFSWYLKNCWFFLVCYSHLNDN